MKSAFITLVCGFFTCILFAFKANGQGCTVQFSLNTQALVDNFPNDYPGCTQVQGNLFVGGDVTNLNALSQIESITGSLWVDGTNVLTSLDGLNNLTQIGENLIIQDNQNLVSISALESLTKLGAYLGILLNPELSTLNGLQNVTDFNSNGIIVGSVGEDVDINSNNKLSNISAIENIYIDCIETHIFFSPLLSNCNIFSICNNPSKLKAFGNGSGCNNYVNNNYVGLNGCYSNPTLFVSANSINLNQTFIVTGEHFSASSPVNLIITNNSTQQIINTNSNSSGQINYQVSTTGMVAGTLKIKAIDAVSNLQTTEKTVIINPINSQTSFLNLTSQQGNTTYAFGQDIGVDFNDKLQATFGQVAYPLQSNTANRLYSYDIEYKIGNAGVWQIAKNISGAGLLNSNINLSSTIQIFASDPNCKIRIKDTYAPTNISESGWFAIQPNNSNSNIKIVKSFDYSFPYPLAIVQGVAADGVARIYVKVKKENQGTGAQIQSVSVNLENGVNTSTSLLGKIQKANDINAYSLEANNANSITASNSSPINNDFWFWYVAPDDFTEIGVNQLPDASERVVKLNFTVNFTDGSTQNKIEEIKIVRPPLIMVHGLASSADAFNSFQYSIGGGIPLSNQLFVSSPLFKHKRALNLIPDAPYAVNANILLSPNFNGTNINSLQQNIDEIRNQGYACNQVDYVCHSMGGCVLRTAMTQFANKFYGMGGASNDAYKSYGKGFVHKLITINTPHEGSPVADLVKEYAPSFPFGWKVFFTNWYSISPNNQVFDFIKPANPNSYFFDWEASDAVSDLQISNSTGGVNLGTTNVKHHFIVGDVDLFYGNSSFLGGWDEYVKLVDGLLDAMLDIVQDPVTKNYLNNLKTLNAVLRVFTFSEWYMAQKGYSNFLGDGDIIVPLKSQIAGESSPPINSTVFNSTSLINANHVQITNRLDVGNSVKLLLDESVFSSSFGDVIPATQNLTGGGDEFKKLENIQLNSTQFDTSKVVIDFPIRNQVLFADSIFTIRVRLKDSVSYQNLQIVFQNQVFSSQNRDTIQTFSLQTSPNLLGSRLVIAQATYYGSGSVDYFIDTLSVNVVSNAQLGGFVVSPEVKSIYSNIPFYPDYKAVYDAFVAIVPHNDPNIIVTIANPSIVSYSNTDFSFSGLVSGSTFAEISFQGYKDTIYINVLGDTTSTTSTHELPKPTEPVTDIALGAYPNPTSGALNVTYDLPIKSNVRIALVNSNGQMHNLGYYTNQVQGRHDRLIYMPSDLPNGVYYLQVSTQFGNYSIPIVYNK